MKRLTITIEPSVFDKLPRKNRSAAINLILKQHYRQDEDDGAVIADELLADPKFVKRLYTRLQRESQESGML